MSVENSILCRQFFFIFITLSCSGREQSYFLELRSLTEDKSTLLTLKKIKPCDEIPKLIRLLISDLDSKKQNCSLPQHDNVIKMKKNWRHRTEFSH